MIRRLLFAILLLPLPATAGEVPAATAGLQSHVVFTHDAPLARSAELVQRLLSPLEALRVNEAALHPGRAMREQALDPAHESFAVYVPARVPLHGYALLVFVPPWPEAAVPPTWIPTLDRHGTIFVGAANSGNDANVLDRRIPLALLAAQNIMQRYPVDPQRVYIGGFSGGSRVAERIALAYPDLFHGALLMAGSDPIGNAQLVLPPASLFRQFQESTRLVYLTGQNDAFHLDLDTRSRQSLRKWCMSHVDIVPVPGAGHELADPAPLHRALDALDKPTPLDTDKLAACRTRTDKQLTAQLQQVERLLTDGKLDDARKHLEKVDAHYGGLAAPRSVELAARIETPH
jgi:dienelactone hydrolase